MGIWRTVGIAPLDVNFVTRWCEWSASHKTILTPRKRQLPVPYSIDQMGSTTHLRASLDILERDIKHAPAGSQTSSDTHPTASNTFLRPVKTVSNFPSMHIRPSHFKQNFLGFSHWHHTCYMPHESNFFWFDESLCLSNVFHSMQLKCTDKW